MVNVAEEVENAPRTMPAAILATLVITTVLYLAVAIVAVSALPLDTLAGTDAPLALLFQKLTGGSSAPIAAIAMAAVVNGALIQIIMASRVLYGLGEQGSVHPIFARINARTRTPLIATATITGIVLILALGFPLEGLAEWTSRIILVIFALVNMALLLLKRRGTPAPEGSFTVKIWVPVAGFLTCLAFLASGFVS